MRSRDPEFSTFMDGYWKKGDGHEIKSTWKNQEKYYAQNQRLWDFVRFVESWIGNPASSYSTDALEGLFGMTRDKIGALVEAQPLADGGELGAGHRCSTEEL